MSYSPGGAGGRVRRGANLSDSSRGGSYPRELAETDFMAKAVVYDPRTQSHTHERPRVRQRDSGGGGGGGHFRGGGEGYDERSYDGSYESEDSDYSHGDRSQRSDHRQHVYDHDESDERGDRYDFADSYARGEDAAIERDRGGGNPFRETSDRERQRQQNNNPFAQRGLHDVLEL